MSWYADTSSEDVKTAVLCACDVLADDVGGVEACGTNGGFCLRLIQPLPDLWVLPLLLLRMLLLLLLQNQTLRVVGALHG